MHSNTCKWHTIHNINKYNHIVKLTWNRSYSNRKRIPQLLKRGIIQAEGYSPRQWDQILLAPRSGGERDG